MKEWKNPTIDFYNFEAEDILTTSSVDPGFGGTFEDED